MTATERLRALLDKRGVEWEEPDPYQDATAWVGTNNIEYIAHEGISFDGPTGRLILFCLTPEQAVEATLGRDEVADLRQALADLWPRASFTMCPENRESWLERLAELGVEVES